MYFQLHRTAIISCIYYVISTSCFLPGGLSNQNDTTSLTTVCVHTTHKLKYIYSEVWIHGKQWGMVLQAINISNYSIIMSIKCHHTTCITVITTVVFNWQVYQLLSKLLLNCCSVETKLVSNYCTVWWLFIDKYCIVFDVYHYNKIFYLKLFTWLEI